MNLQDANTIKKVFSQRKMELEHMEPIKSSIRIRLVPPNTCFFSTCNAGSRQRLTGAENFVCNSVLFCFGLIRNRKSVHGDRLSSITMALQYGSESDEDGILTGIFLLITGYYWFTITAGHFNT